MCGIAGIFSHNTPVVPSDLEVMNQQLVHRGPDADGFHFSPSAGGGPSVGLAMRRLKVIDLETGNQPIHEGNQKYWIVFNGEIYNYRELRADLEKKGHKFYTHSDTEVILHQFLEDKENCVHKFAGMFAFAIYDTANQSLFIARDRLGVKPLFYHPSSSGLVFGSEIKAVLHHPWVSSSPDPQAVSHYLSLNYLPAPWTPFKNIFQLPAGHWMKVTADKVKTQQYWDVPLGETIDVSEGEALKEIERLMHQSMTRRLIADVPVGAFLSGGMDSSTLVYLMKEQRHDRVKTFSTGFDQAGYDETPYAREVAKKFGTDHHEIHCTPDDVIHTLPKIAWHADCLLADQAALPLYQVSKLAKRHVTVCLSGDGGDEVFVGYPTFHANRYHGIYSNIPGFVRSAFIEPFVKALPGSTEKLSFEYKAKKFIQAGNFTPEKAHYWWRTIFTDSEKNRLLRPEILKTVQPDGYELYGKFLEQAKGGYVDRCLYADLKVWLAANNLYKVDTMTMAHGLEARVPFLDHQLVEYMAMLPVSLKFRGNVLKYLLKKMVKGKLPESVRTRKKAGWHTPIAGWFRGPLKSHLTEKLLDPKAQIREWTNRDEVERILDEHFRGRNNHAFKLWSLLILEHWLESFFSPNRALQGTD